MKKYYCLLAISAIISIFSFTAKAVELQEVIESSSHQISIEELMSPNPLIPTSVFVVNNTGDNSDALPGDGLCDDGGGGCSFRGAIQEANAFAGANIIDFNIPGGCHQTIYPSAALPTITESVTINGYSQPGALPNTAATGSNAILCIMLDGFFVGGFNDGLQINAVNTTVRGLNIRRWTDAGIEVSTGNGSIIEGNFIGTDLSGTSAMANRIGVSVFASNVRVGGSTLVSRNIIGGNTRMGIALTEPASGNLVQNNYIGVGAISAALGNGNSGISVFRSSANTIGGTTASVRNVISGNGTNIAGGFDGSGIYIYGDTLFSQSPNNIIRGNYIGTDPTGTAAIANTTHGVRIDGSINTIIGGGATGSGNLISGNATDGISISESGATGNIVRGNIIGLTLDRLNDLGNLRDGVRIDGVAANTVGGENAGEGNFIAGNDNNGIYILNAGANNNLVQGNIIGMSLTEIPLPQSAGVLITNGTDNTIGGTTTGARNIIGGNLNYGIAVAFTNNITIQGNWIGIGASGSPVGNNDGLLIQDAANNTVGGTTSGAGNVISGNGIGVRIVSFSLPTTGNVLQGNLIGTDPFGTVAVPNNGQGVLLQTADANIIGGTSAAARNIISGNNQGIKLQFSSTNNIIQGNYIGTKINGLEALPNVAGVQIEGSGSTGNIVGGTATGAGNVVSGNTTNGVQMNNLANNNRVEGNIVGLKADGSAALPNANGVLLFERANTNNIGGTAANAGNVLSGNTFSGIVLVDGANLNRIEGNKIGTDATGTIDLGNGLNGVRLVQGSIITNVTTGNTIGGTIPSARNLISGNTVGGVYIGGSTTTNNTIAGNYIGTTADGNGYLKNDNFGVRIEAPNNIIGGATTAHRNVISGQFLSNEIGVQILNTGLNTLVQNNYIGTNVAGDAYLFNGSNIVVSGSGFTVDSNLISGALFGLNCGNTTSGFITNNKFGTNADATAFLGNGFSVFLQSCQNTKIGEDSGGNTAPNIIAGGVGTGRAGITITGNGTGNLFRQNSIYDNSGIGIDLGNDGVTQNDQGDPDLANNYQNFPVLTNIMTTIDGTLNSTPNRSFRIEFYSSPTADPTGYGEGRNFVTELNITTDAGGNAAFSIPNPIPLGSYISATATDLTTNDTSEFSAYKQVLAPTAVKFAGAIATKFTNGVLLEWETGFEADNLGFNVYREINGRRDLINDSLIAGSALMTEARLQSGFNYQWFDANASKDTVYYIEAVDLNSTKETYGAFGVSWFFNEDFSNINSARLSEINKSRADKTNFAESKAKAVEKPSEEQLSNQNALTRFEGVRLGVKNSGYYRVSAAELFANGLPTNANPNGLRLFADGIEQPINVVLNENGTLRWIEFYGIGIDSTETDLRTYQLIASSEQGRRIEKIHSEGSPSNQTFYTATVERQDRTLYFAGLLNDQEENFFGAVINSNGTQTDLMLRNLAEMGGNTEIYVKLQGLTRSSHNVKVEINGQFIGNINFEAMLKGTFETQISTGFLREGTNTISFTSLSGANDLSLIEDIQIKFPRELKAYKNRIEITAQSGQEITVEGFTSGEVRVFDVTDANNVIELSAKVILNENGREAANSTDIFKVLFTPSGNGERKILALENNSNLAEISPNLASDLRTTQGGDLLIITKREMFRSMYPLMKQRQGQGLRSVLADVQDIYDEFNFSQKSTQAIKNFLQFAYANWQIKPRYVIFAGDSTYDPKRYLGGNVDVVPTRLFDTLTMETASDEWFGDFNGDNIAEFSIGRLPAKNAEELGAIINKIMNYERQTMPNSAAFVSDISDGFDFSGSNAAVRETLPQGVTVQDIRRGEESDPAVKSRILNAINSGQKILTYTGHGSIGIWRGNVFTKADAENLTNSNLPIFVTMTCLNGYFHDAFNMSLSETLLKNINGGAIAVWTSTGAGLPDSYGSLNVEIHRSLFNGATLGEAHLQAKRAVSNQDVLQTFALLGDPSMRMR